MDHPTAVLTMTTTAVATIVENQPDPATATPCSQWSYAQVLGHLVGGDRTVAAIIQGRAAAVPGHRSAPAADRPAPSAEAYRAASGRLATLLADPTVRAGVYTLPVGPLPGEAVVLLRSVEHLLHGWDLARSAGLPTTNLEPVAAALIEPAGRLLASVNATRVPDHRPFADPVRLDAAPDGGEPTALDAMVALFGRDPGWEPDPIAGYERLKDHFAQTADVELPDGTRRGYGADGMRVGGSVFACTHRGRLMIKLPATEVAGLIESGRGLPLAKPGRRPMREWVLVPFDGSATRRAERAYAFVRDGA
jgi:uncharacterized protein (TIGR03086 family)